MQRLRYTPTRQTNVDRTLELEKAIQAETRGYTDAYNALAVVSHRQKQYQKAIENYLLVIETNPHHVRACTNLTTIYHVVGPLPGAFRRPQQYPGRSVRRNCRTTR